MDYQLTLEEFNRCPGCYERLASQCASDHNVSITHVICYNPVCDDFNLVYPEGYGARLVQGDRRIPSQARDLSARHIDPLLLGDDTSVFPGYNPDWQDLDSMLVDSPSQAPQITSAFLPMGPSGSLTDNLTGQPNQSANAPIPQSSSPIVGGKNQVRLEKPFSELTNLSQEPIQAVEAYVNRSVQVRSIEAQAKGRVLRPANAFILYRKAYQSCAKEFCAQANANAEAASPVVAESWRLETEEVRGRFQEFARIDSANHRLAHPGYKYAPKLKNSC